MKYSQVTRQQGELPFELKLQGDYKTLIVTCSDSRVLPRLNPLTQAKHVFMMSSIGNRVTPFSEYESLESATIERAVRYYEVKNIVICGHSHCGAMSSLLSSRKPGGALETNDQALDLMIQENVILQLENLITYSFIHENQISLHGWVYHSDSDGVVAYDTKMKRFLPHVELLEEMWRPGGASHYH